MYSVCVVHVCVIGLCMYKYVRICIYFKFMHSVYIFLTVHAHLSIFTSTPTPCYGEEVTLVCHHPEVASNPGKYTTTTPTWKENGTKITPSDGTKYEDETPLDLTRTTLTINITLDYFRNKSFNYYCLLVLAGLDGQPDGMETSGEVNVNPVGE